MFFSRDWREMIQPRWSWLSKWAAPGWNCRQRVKQAAFEPLEGRLLLTADLVISEFLASNHLGLRDYDSDDSDWIEIHNRGTSDADLLGWHLTDSSQNLTKWKFSAPISLAADERLVVFASGKDFMAPTGEFHTNFKLRSDGEFLALADPAGTVVDSYSPEFTAQATDVSYGIAVKERETAEGIYFMATPTPGVANFAGFAGITVTPSFSVTSQTFLDEISVQLSISDVNAVIRYTTDGTAPVETSTLYTEALTVSTTTQIRARAFRSEFVPSEVVSETYIKLASDVLQESSNLPFIVIDNYQQNVPVDRVFRDGFMAVFEPDATGRSRLTNSADLTSRIVWHRRGASTFGNPKLNMRIETTDEVGADRPVQLLGLPSESDFILFGPYKHDRALVRNPFIFELSHQMGRYAPHTRFVEVYGNLTDDEVSQSDYLGLYILEENIKPDANRVDIQRLSPQYDSEPEITGGYLLERCFCEGGVFTFAFNDPDISQITTPQKAYLKQFLTDLQVALYSSNFTDPTVGYRAYLDAAAAVDHHILRYLGKPIEQFSISTYLHKDRGEKLKFGPIWDFDKSMGSDEFSANPIGVDFRTFWFDQLFKDPDFEQQWVDRWQQLRTTLLTDENFAAVIDGMVTQIAEAQTRNFARWTEVSPVGGEFSEPGLTGWEAEVSHLKGWLTGRLEWTDSLLLQPVSLSAHAGVVHHGFEFTLSAPQGTIHYTLDGSDPRSPGGAIRAGAIEYTGQPIVLHQSAQVFARAFQSETGLDGWSGPSSVTLTVLPGDFNGNGLHDADDINRLFAKLGSNNLVFDLDDNGDVDQADVDYLVQTILDTHYGDTDLDGDVDTSDLTRAIINFNSAGGSGKFWADGETDGDGDVDTQDLTRAIINFTGAKAGGQSVLAHRDSAGESNTHQVVSQMVDLPITQRAIVNDQHVALTTNIDPAHLTQVLAGGASREQASTYKSIFQSESDWLADR